MYFFLYRRRAIVSPIIDAISDQDFAYLTGTLANWGGFNGRMEFRWFEIPKRERERNAYDTSLPSRFVLECCLSLSHIIFSCLIN